MTWSFCRFLDVLVRSMLRLLSSDLPSLKNAAYSPPELLLTLTAHGLLGDSTRIADRYRSILVRGSDRMRRYLTIAVRHDQILFDGRYSFPSLISCFYAFLQVEMTRF